MLSLYLKERPPKLGHKCFDMSGVLAQSSGVGSDMTIHTKIHPAVFDPKCCEENPECCGHDPNGDPKGGSGEGDENTTQGTTP